MVDPKEHSQHDRDRLWDAVKELADKVDALGTRFGDTWERFTSGVNATSNELRARIIALEEGHKTAKGDRDDIRSKVGKLEERNEREDRDWKERAWKVGLSIAIAYLCVRLGLGSGK